MSDVSYRLATAADIEPLVKLRLDFLAENGHDFSSIRTLPDDIRAYCLQAMSKGEFVVAVAEIGGAIIGVAGIIYDRRPPKVTNPKGINAYILNVYVVPPCRRKGIATALVQILVVHAQQSGCKSASLHALPGGREVYAKIGFKPVENEMRRDF